MTTDLTAHAGARIDATKPPVTPFFPGTGQGPALVLAAPLSFWGGIDPATGNIIAVRHPQHRANIAGTVLFMPAPIGSSSSSAVLLELIRNGHAPAAIILGEADAILVVGCLVAREMQWRAPPVLVDASIRTQVPDTGAMIAVTDTGWRRA